MVAIGRLCQSNLNPSSNCHPLIVLCQQLSALVASVLIIYIALNWLLFWLVGLYQERLENEKRIIDARNDLERFLREGKQPDHQLVELANMAIENDETEEDQGTRDCEVCSGWFPFGAPCWCHTRCGQLYRNVLVPNARGSRSANVPHRGLRKQLNVNFVLVGWNVSGQASN